ncbi:hypothetical protein ZWY2020_046068 [Hordeum vulgare]|nr:hypothetical protein ZWY2020_046068 [Hordeum vulgare]
MDLSFESRPNILVSEIFCYGGRNVILAPFGPYWRMTRKLCTVELLSERKATFGQVCDEELQDRFMAVTGLAIKVAGGSSVGDLVPSLWFVDALTGLRGRLWRARQLDAILDKIIADECREGSEVTTFSEYCLGSRMREP